MPFPPGGNSDALARTLAERLREHLGGATIVADARADIISDNQAVCGGKAAGD